MNWYKKAQLTSRTVTVQDMGSYRNIVPIITLRGKWLMDAGFYPKDKLSISVSKNTLNVAISEPNMESREYAERLKQQKAEDKERREEMKKQPDLYKPIKMPPRTPPNVIPMKYPEPESYEYKVSE